MNKRSVGVLVCVGLLASLVALPAVAAEYYNWDAWATFSPWSLSNTPTNCGTPGCEDNTGNGACWQADVATTPGVLYMDLLCAPSDGTQDYRMQFSTSNPKPKFTDYPWAKMKLTVSGVPEGALIRVVMQFETNESGGKYRHGIWIGNGTYILAQYMGTDTAIYDPDGSTPTVPDAAWTMKRLRFQFLVASIPGWETAWQDVSINIDWIVVTDNPYYPDVSAGAGGAITSTPAYIFEGRPAALVAPEGSGYQWFKGVNPVYDDEQLHPPTSPAPILPPTRINGALSQALSFSSLAAEDAGTYTCTYYSGGNLLTSSFDLSIDSAPATGPGVITSDPLPGWIQTGGNLTLTAPSGSGYQWYVDNVPIENSDRISGANLQVLVFTPALQDDAGSYTCVYDDGTGGKVLLETLPFELEVLAAGSLPVAGIAGLALAAAALVALAARGMRRR